MPRKSETEKLRERVSLKVRMREPTFELAGRTKHEVVGVLVPNSVYCDSDGEWLSYSWSPAVTDCRALNGMLDAFLRIRDASGVKRFAERWGVLGICQHDLPASHIPLSIVGSYSLASRSAAKPCFPRHALSGSPGAYSEPVETWRRYVAEANDVWDAAIALHTKQPSVPAERDKPAEDEDKPVIDAEELRRRVSAVMNRWLILGDVRPTFNWESGPGPVIGWRGDERGYAFGVLAIQLLVAVSRAHDLAVCSACRQMYLREERQPQTGKGNYCKECKMQGRDARLRKQRQRARANLST